MPKEYKFEKDNIFDVLDDIDNFMSKMDTFMEKHPEYGYEIKIERGEKLRSLAKWVVHLKVTN